MSDNSFDPSTILFLEFWDTIGLKIKYILSTIYQLMTKEKQLFSGIIVAYVFINMEDFLDNFIIWVI